MPYDTTTSNPHAHQHSLILFIHFINGRVFRPLCPILVPNVPPNLIIASMCVNICLIPLLGRTHTTVGKVTRLGRLAVGLDAASLVKRDLAVVACAAGGRAVFYFGAGELALDVCGVNA